MNPRPFINAALVIIIVIGLFGSYSGWGWSIVAVLATVFLTRPWLAAEYVRSSGSGGFVARSA